MPSHGRRVRQRPRVCAELSAAVRASGYSLVSLAGLTGYPAHTCLSVILVRRSIASTALARERAHRLAQIIGDAGRRAQLNSAATRL